MLRLLSLMPAAMPYRLAGGIARLWMRLSPVKRHTTERNLERCLPELEPAEREAMVEESFRHYVCAILESGHNWYWSGEKLKSLCVELVNEDLYWKCHNAGKGMIALAPHFGAWEYLGMYLQSVTNAAILYKPPRNPELAKALLAKRARGGGLFIPATAHGLRDLYEHILAGEAAGILPDQQPSEGRARFAPFFGNLALTGELVPWLVQRTGCSVLAVACERLEGGRFRVHLLPVDDEIHSSDTVAALTAMNRAVERCVAIDPAQYLWSYRRFKTQPEGEPPFYDFR